MVDRLAGWGFCVGGVVLLAAFAAPGRTPPEIPLVPVPPPPLGVPAKAVPVAAGIPARPRTAKELLEAARARLPELDSYIVRLVRRETVNGKPGAEEVMLCRYRSRPWSVYFKWLGKEGNGREVIHVKGGKIHTLLAAGDVPFMPAGKRMALSPDNVLVKSACRHPITEAGLAACIERVDRLLSDIQARGEKAGTVTILGPLQRPEFGKPVLALEHKLPLREDETLPLGGKRTYYFCPDSHLPMLVIAEDEKGQEVEYYRHDRLMTDVKLDDADFDPERLWKADERAGR